MDARTTEPATELPAFEWEAPVLDVQSGLVRKHRPAIAAPKAASVPLPAAGVLDRYVAARFPTLARCAADLRDPARVTAGARLFFEERKTDRAFELLALAIAQCPGHEGLKLARLEIAYLMREPQTYVALASEFRQAHAASPAWIEVCRLGRALKPDEKMFGARQANRAHDHYGPWPHTPNWIDASWDLTSEVLAVDYHRAMADTAERAGGDTLRLAA
jgi:hypothetical protein